MKNTDIHIGLDKAEMRDLIAKEFKNTTPINTGYSYYVGKKNLKEVLGFQLEQAQKDLENAKLEVENIKIRIGYHAIMEQLGWEEFDVSDETFRSPNGWMSFIGTQEEYDTLINTIKNEK